ncbi:hypothetical protein DNTS_027971 [Danionella cerebrum]|uniref:Uncharacterized protein n=1 Tax=Danionella cerebrum TaxID=2873325 RepID=A0A553Q165_9TELE|nr:hypothetical protein DNTS_027971 [Danionella translucida]
MTRYCSLLRRLLSRGSKGEDEEEDEAVTKSLAVEPGVTTLYRLLHEDAAVEPLERGKRVSFVDAESTVMKVVSPYSGSAHAAVSVRGEKRTGEHRHRRETQGDTKRDLTEMKERERGCSEEHGEREPVMKMGQQSKKERAKWRKRLAMLRGALEKRGGH